MHKQKYKLHQKNYIMVQKENLHYKKKYYVNNVKEQDQKMEH